MKFVLKTNFLKKKLKLRKNILNAYLILLLKVKSTHAHIPIKLKG